MASCEGSSVDADLALDDDLAPEADFAAELDVDLESDRRSSTNNTTVSDPMLSRDRWWGLSTCFALVFHGLT